MPKEVVETKVSSSLSLPPSPSNQTSYLRLVNTFSDLS